MKQWAVVCLVGLSLGLSALGTRVVQAAERVASTAPTQVRNVQPFQGVAMWGGFDMRVSQGATHRVSVQTEEALQDLLETVVEGADAEARLMVRWKRGAKVPSNAKVWVNVVTPRLTALRLDGSGDLHLEAFTTPALAVALTGNGDVHLHALTTEELDINIVGNGDITAQGRTQRLKVKLQGNGDVRLLALQADAAAVSVLGNGDVSLNAARALSVQIAGNGDVVYSGEAQLASSILGSGSVRKKR
jgi:hypothetical protein